MNRFFVFVFNKYFFFTDQYNNLEHLPSLTKSLHQEEKFSELPSMMTGPEHRMVQETEVRYC